MRAERIELHHPQIGGHATLVKHRWNKENGVFGGIDDFSEVIHRKSRNSDRQEQGTSLS